MWFGGVQCVVSPPPNPFNYPCGESNRVSDVHCSVDIYEEEEGENEEDNEEDNEEESEDEKVICKRQRVGEEVDFHSSLRKYLKSFLGGANISSCSCRGSDAFPFASLLDICQFEQRPLKMSRYASGNHYDCNLKRPHVTEAWVTVTSIDSFGLLLKPFPNLNRLHILYDASPQEKNQKPIVCEELEGLSLTSLSLSYHDSKIQKYNIDFPSSQKLFTTILYGLKSIDHLELGKMATFEHIAPVLRAALTRQLQSLSIPLCDIGGYLQLLSSHRDIFVDFSSSVKCVVITGYDVDILIAPYVCHLIRFFANIASLKLLIFDMGGDYNDDVEVEKLASVIKRAKLETAAARNLSKLEVFLDFEV